MRKYFDGGGGGGVNLEILNMSILKPKMKTVKVGLTTQMIIFLKTAETILIKFQ
jgi:hypothetical protein